MNWRPEGTHRRIAEPYSIMAERAPSGRWRYMLYFKPGTQAVALGCFPTFEEATDHADEHAEMHGVEAAA